MKVNKNILMDLVKKASLDGVIDPEMGCAFNFTEEGIRVVIADRSLVLFANILLKKDAIQDYVPIEPIGIKDMNYLGKIVALLGDEIDISVEKNKLRLVSGTKMFKVTIANIKDIYVSEIQITKEQVEEYKSNSAPITMDTSRIRGTTYKLKELSKDTIITFETKENNLNIKAKFNTDIMMDTMEITGVTGQEKATFSIKNLECITNSLSASSFDMYIKTESPIVFVEKDDIFNCWYLLAPRLDD